MSSVLMLKLIRYKQDLIMIVLMVALSLAFIFVLGGSNEGIYKYDILVATDAKTPSYERFITELNKNKSYSFQESEYDEVKAEVEEGKILAGIYFKEDKISILKTKEDINIFILENLASNTLFNIQSISGIAAEVTEYLNELKIIDKESVEQIAYNDIQESFNRRKSMSTTKSFLNSSNVKEYNNFKHITIGMILYLSMYTMVFGIGSILQDKKYHIWDKMLISPLKKRDMLGGNLIYIFLIGAVQISLLILITKYLMGMDWGDSLLGVMLVAFAFIFATTSLGLLISSLVKNQSQLSAISPIVLTGTSMIGGTMWPLEIVQSKTLLFLANLTPQKWAVEGIEQIVMYGKGIGDILPNLGILVLMGTIFFVIGVKKI